MKKLLLALVAIGAVLVGYGAASALAYPAAGVFGRGEYNGFFTNVNDTDGLEVLRPVYNGEAIRPGINTADEFIDFIKYTKLDIDNNGSGTTQDKTGAAFIIHTMIGTAAGSRSRPPTAGQIAEWEARVRFSEARGWITWRTNFSYSINSFYQGARTGSNPNDDAFYDNSGTRAAMIFRDATGRVVYAIKWDCGNPIGQGTLSPIPNDADFNMSGRTTVSNLTPLPGQTVTFRHYLRNAGPNATSPTVINWSNINSLTGAVLNGPASSGTYTVGQEKNVFNEPVLIPNAAPGTRICRHVRWTPDTGLGGTQNGTPVCVTIPPPSYSCGSVSMSPGSPEPTEPFTVRVSILYSYGPPTSPSSVNIRVPGVSPAINGNYAYTSAGTIPGTLTSVAVGPVSAPAPGKYPITWTLNAPFGTVTCNSTVDVVSKPYFKAFGNDVSAGGSFSSGGVSCNTTGIVAGFYSVSQNKGSAVQFAAEVLGTITEFASAGMRNTAPLPAVGLTLANVGASPPGNWGGNFGGGHCITDYWATKPAALAINTIDIPNLTPLVNPSTQQPNLLTYAYKSTTPGQPVTLFLPPGKVAKGNKAAIYVDGDAYIPKNMGLTDNNWNSLTEIPSLYIIVHGNIYIDPTVTNLEGVYIAQPNGSVGGSIFTCATLNGKLPATQIPSQCGQQLTVYGAFIAKSIKLNRSGYTMRNATQTEFPLNATNPACGRNVCASEVFSFGPETYLSRPGFAPSGGTSQGIYDSITSLSPTL